MCRSVPQIVVVSTFTITSVGSWMPGSSTLSQDRCPAPPNTNAFIVSPFFDVGHVNTAALPRRCMGTTLRMADGLDEAREWLETMLLIRRFEERAGQMYAKNKVGGFLHLAIGEEATIVGAVRAMRDEDYLISTYRSHGHALARGTDPKYVMAELFGKKTGVSGGRGGSMHMFDGERRFMGGYGIVGGNLPLAAGIALSTDYRETDEVTVCVFGDGAANQGTFGETLNLAALWHLPVVFMVTNNQFGMGTVAGAPLRAAGPAQARRGLRRLGPALRRDGHQRHLHGHAGGDRAGAREADADARRGGDLPLRRPLDGRPGGVPDQGAGRGVARARPDPAFAEQLEADLDALDEPVIKRIDEAVEFAEESDFPSPESIYEHLRYV